MLYTYTLGEYQQENYVTSLSSTGDYPCSVHDPPPYRCSQGPSKGCHANVDIACASTCVGPEPHVPHFLCPPDDETSCCCRCNKYWRWRKWGCP